MTVPSNSPRRTARRLPLRLAAVVTAAALLTSACSLVEGPRPAGAASASAPLLAQGLPRNEPLPPEAGLHGPPLVRWRDLVYSPHSHVANLWSVIRKGFHLPDLRNPRIRVEREWYVEHPGYMVRTAYRAKPYLYYIVHAVKKRHIPMEIALLPIVESAYDPFAYSFGRAAGLWQFIPSTARLFGLRMDWWYDGRRDVIASTRAALDYLSQLHQRFGSWLLALAAYNAGAVTVQRAIDYNRERGLPTDYWALDLPPETEAYVPRLLAICEIVDHPKRYGIHLPPIPNRPYLATVHLKAQMSLSLAAHLLGISLRKLYLLNPGFNRWATDPAGPARLVVPRNLKAKFVAALAHLPRRRMVAWAFYRVRPGDTLDAIAARYGIPVSVLMARNGLRSPLIRAGQLLSVPSPGNDYFAYTLHRVPGVGSIRRNLVRRHRLIAYVTPGDTLWTIAQRYGVSIPDLARWNGLNPSAFLYPGQRLVVWSRHAQDQLPVGAASGAPPAVYTVRSGDSLWTIAQRYGLTVAAIRRWNRLGPASVLRPGERLVLHAPARASAPLLASIAGGTRTAPTQVTYTVRPGDSLWSIAQAYHVTPSALEQWNGLGASSVLHPGQSLVIRAPGAAGTGPMVASVSTPLTYTVRPGDSLWSIAQAYHVTPGRLARWNHLPPNGLLQVGEHLVVRPGASGGNLPVDRTQRVVYTVRPGDSLLAISQRFGVSVGQLRRWNGVGASNLIFPGQHLTVYVPVRDEDRGS